MVTSPTFCYDCVEYIKLHTCANIHDHWSNNNKVMIGGGGGGGGITDGSKKPMSNTVKLGPVRLQAYQNEETLYSTVLFFYLGQSKPISTNSFVVDGAAPKFSKMTFPEIESILLNLLTQPRIGDLHVPQVMALIRVS